VPCFLSLSRRLILLPIIDFPKICRPPPRGSLTMCVLIKDLRRSGVYVCANKGLSPKRIAKMRIRWIPNTSQPILRLGLYGLDIPQIFLSELRVSALSALDFFSFFTISIISTTPNMHYNALSITNIIPTCIIMHVLRTWGAPLLRFVTFLPLPPPR